MATATRSVGNGGPTHRRQEKARDAPLRRLAKGLTSLGAAAALAGLAACQSPAPPNLTDRSPGLRGAPIAIDPSTLRRIGTVDERYLSYNVEMLEVTGGRFWKPYSAVQGEASGSSPPAPVAASVTGGTAPTSSTDTTPAGMNPNLYQYRPPVDLANPRLRTLAAALGPAYIRVSGTWANTTYFADTDTPSKSPPPGFDGVLTREQWKGVVDFAHATDARIVTSFANSAGTRNTAGAWTPDLARRFVAYTDAIGGEIAAAEFMNEPDLATMGGAPPGYNGADYDRDVRIFHAFARQTLPGMRILGPGSVGESFGPNPLVTQGPGILSTLTMVADLAETVDDFSYHQYGAASERCKSIDHQTTAEQALTEDWLRNTDQTLAFYRNLRDRYAPGRAFWVTETADAACGGNPWASTFLDTFRYLDQLGRLARQDVRVVMHNTLDSSDYGLLDENTFEPRPNYWAALLWKRLMGSAVLGAPLPIRQGLHVYSQCLRGVPGGVVLLVINNDRSRTTSITLPGTVDRYTLSAQPLTDRQLLLNGVPLALRAGDALPPTRPPPPERRVHDVRACNDHVPRDGAGGQPRLFMNAHRDAALKAHEPHASNSR